MLVSSPPKYAPRLVSHRHPTRQRPSTKNSPVTHAMMLQMHPNEILDTMLGILSLGQRRKTRLFCAPISMAGL